VTGTFSPSPVVVQASTFLVLDTAASTCVIARMTLRLLVVLSVARPALQTAMTTVIVPGSNQTFHLTMQHLNTAVSSRMKTFPAMSTSPSWSSAFSFASPLVSQADIAIDDAKENAWMALYEHDSDTLEDILYSCLQDLWVPLTDTMKVFDTHGSVQQLCAQKVWETLLTFFPLDHERMQTVLLAREIARMIRWDGDSKGAVNRHFASVTDLHRTMGYIGNLSIEDVLKSVLMATLKVSTNRSLRDAYHKVLDDLDDDKTCLSLSSKTLAPASFAATLTSALSAEAPRAPRRALRRSKPRSTTSTSIKEVTNSPSSSATPLKSMVTSQGRSSTEPASLAQSGTSPLQSPTSS
jgi:hypothetical protein